MVEQYMKETLQFVDDQRLHLLAGMDLAGAEEYAKKIPTPFTKEEEEWLNKAMVYYMTQNG